MEFCLLNPELQQELQLTDEYDTYTGVEVNLHGVKLLILGMQINKDKTLFYKGLWTDELAFLNESWCLM